MSLHLWAAICIYESFEKNEYIFNPFSANIAKWSNKLKQFVGSLTTNCLSVFDHFVGLALKGLTVFIDSSKNFNITMKVRTIRYNW